MIGSNAVSGNANLSGSSPSRNASYMRNQLLSRMLRNRGVLRLLVAPDGMGKSTLARQYAAKAFSGIGVSWIDGADPSFVCSLDDGTFPQASQPYDTALRLLIVDDLPALDGQRAKQFSNAIDSMLESGCEVIVASTPSNDCLQALQPDAIRIGPRDFLVDPSKLAGLRLEGVQIACDGTARYPIVSSFAFGDHSKAAADCLRGLLSEGLPDEVVLPAIAMALLEKGSLADLEDIGIEASAPACELLESSYPYFGVDTAKRIFATMPFSIRSIRVARGRMPKKWRLQGGQVEKAASLLLSRGEAVRAIEAMRVFLDPKAQAGWAAENGMAIIDLGACEAFNEFLQPMPGAPFAEQGLLASSLWALALSGNLARERALVPQMHAMPDDDEALSFWLLGHAPGGNAIGEIAAMAESCSTPCALLLDGVELGPKYRVGGACAREDPSCWKTCLPRHILALAICAAQGAEGCDARELERLAFLLERTAAMQDQPAWRLALHLVSSLSYAEPSCDAAAKRCSELLDAFDAEPAATLTSAMLAIDAEKHSVGERGLWRQAHDLLSHAFETMGRKTFDALCDVTEYPVGYLLAPLAGLVGCAAEGAGDACQGEKNEDEAPPAGLIALDKFSAAARPRAAFEDGVPKLYIKMFGGFEAYRGGELLDNASAHKRQVKELLAYLVLHKGREVPRGAILREMWPAFDSVRARNSFYVVWSSMKQGLLAGNSTLPYIERGESTCHVNLAYVDSDIYDFDNIVTAILDGDRQPKEMMMLFVTLEHLYSGDLLAGDFSSTFFETKRVLYRDMFIDTMVKASSIASDSGDCLVAKWFARKALEYGESREDAYQVLIKAQLLAGQRAAAVQTYRMCKNALARDLGVSPSAQTSRMIRDGIAQHARWGATKGPDRQIGA